MIEAILKDKNQKFVALFKLSDPDVGIIRYQNKLYNYCRQAGQDVFWETSIHDVQESDVLATSSPSQTAPAPSSTPAKIAR